MNRIIINYDKDRVCAALVEADQLVEFHIERTAEKLVGNIYVGKVMNVLPGMQAAFIDIGLDRNAFLYVDDTYYSGDDEKCEGEHPHNINEVLHEGEMILVQVKKEMFGNKGPRVTSYVSFAGRLVVYFPHSDHVGISKKITDETDRESLRAIGQKLLQDDDGMIIRTKALDVEITAIEEDLNVQRNLWRKILKKSEGITKPTLIYKDIDLSYRLIRDIFTADIDELVIDDAEEFVQIKEFMSETIEDLADRLILYQGKDIFAEYNIEHEIGKLIKRKVWLKSGGYIVIEQTEALTVIDVNTGKYVGRTCLEDTLYRTNLEAAAEAAKQLRLRDIGGIIIIDFIDMEDPDHKEQIVAKLTTELSKDRMRTSVSGMTPLGLVELTRKKVRTSIETTLLRACPCCDGRGRVYAEDKIYSLLRKEARELEGHSDASDLILEVSPFIAEQLKQDDESQLIELSKLAGKKITLRENPFLNLNSFHFLFK